jgi:Flp pilus assembly protein TadD
MRSLVFTPDTPGAVSMRQLKCSGHMRIVSFQGGMRLLVIFVAAISTAILLPPPPSVTITFLMASIATRFAQAVQHHEAGRLVEAEALYRGILREAPRQVQVLHLLGVLAHQLGRPHEAIELIGQALTLHGPQPLFHSNLSAAYLAAGLLGEAEAQARAAVQLKPDLADAQNNLGVALRRQGKLEGAELAFREAVRLEPGHVDARTNLGATLQQQGKLAEALVHLQEALRLAPGDAQAHNDLGGTLIAARRPEEAIEHLRTALRLKPAFPEAYSNLGVALRKLNQVDEAVLCFREALRLNPGYARARNNLGHSLQVLNKIDLARAEFQEVQRQEPANPLTLGHLSNLAIHGHYQFSADEMRLLQELAARPDLSSEDSCRVHFSLARLLDKAGAYDEAFAHFARGNELRKEDDRRNGVAFDVDLHRRLIERLIATCTPAYFERVASFGVNSELPIFIIGMMRSGTTLVEQILASHPQVHGAGELPDIEILISRLEVRDEGRGTRGEPYPECLALLDAATARALAEQHLERLRQRGGQASRVVDKLPFNFMHLGFIAALFSKARIIHCRRNPVDTCLSSFFQNFTDPHPFAFDLRHLGQYYREYERLMAHWVKVLPLPIFELQYEELTADQEAVSKRLIAFCGLDWDERCLRFNETERPVRTASTLQVRQPMYRTSVGRWKHYEAHLRPLLEALGSASGEW